MGRGAEVAGGASHQPPHLSYSGSCRNGNNGFQTPAGTFPLKLALRDKTAGVSWSQQSPRDGSAFAIRSVALDRVSALTRDSSAHVVHSRAAQHAASALRRRLQPGISINWACSARGYCAASYAIHSKSHPKVPPTDGADAQREPRAGVLQGPRILAPGPNAQRGAGRTQEHERSPLHTVFDHLTADAPDAAAASTP